MRVNHYYHKVTDSTAIAAVGTSFATAKKHTIQLGSFPDGSAWTGITTATDGSVTYVLDFIQATPTNDTVYIFYKTDTGTVTIDSVTLTWEE